MNRARNRLLLVDALNLIRRVYAAQPGEDGPERAEGAKASSVQSLRRALVECTPTHVACVFEGEGKSWRHELWPGYKAGHAAMPEALASALDSYREAFLELGVVSLQREGLEADDVIATAAVKAVEVGVSAIILSTDKGFLQLLAEGVRVRNHFDRTELDADYVLGRFGVGTHELADAMALAGDPGNGIPGVAGVGIKTAAKLIARFGTLEDALESADEIEGKLGERVREHAETARICRRLVGLRTDLELGVHLSDLRYRPEPVEFENESGSGRPGPIPGPMGLPSS